MADAFVIHGLEPGEDLLGFWQTRLPEPGAAFDFSATGTAPAVAADTLRWQVTLPADLAQAQAVLRRRQTEVTSSARSVAQAGQQLEDPAFTPAAFTDDIVSFAGPADPELSQAVLDLQQTWDVLAAPDDIGAYGLGDWVRSAAESARGLFDRATDAVAAPLRDRLPAGFQDQAADFQKFVNQTLRLLRPTLAVETTLGTQHMATSQIDLSGDIDTLWRQTLSDDLAALHLQALDLSLESRLALIQLLGQVSGGAAALALKAGTPGGFLLLVPSVYNYLKTIIAQTRKLAELQGRSTPTSVS